MKSKNEPLWRRVFNWFSPPRTGFVEHRQTSGQNARSEVPDMLKAGAAILDALMRFHGFAFRPTQAGTARGGSFASSRYLGFSKDLLDGFRHLLADWQQQRSDFLAGSDADFARHVQHAETLKQTGPACRRKAGTRLKRA